MHICFSGQDHEAVSGCSRRRTAAELVRPCTRPAVGVRLHRHAMALHTLTDARAHTHTHGAFEDHRPLEDLDKRGRMLVSSNAFLLLAPCIIFSACLATCMHRVHNSTISLNSHYDISHTPIISHAACHLCIIRVLRSCKLQHQFTYYRNRMY